MVGSMFLSGMKARHFLQINNCERKHMTSVKKLQYHNPPVCRLHIVLSAILDRHIFPLRYHDILFNMSVSEGKIENDQQWKGGNPGIVTVSD